MSREIPQAQVLTAAPVYTNNSFHNLTLDAAGRLQVTAGGAGVGIVVGNKTPTDAYVNPTDALDAYALLGSFNGVTWDRARNKLVDGSAMSAVTRGIQTTAQLYANSAGVPFPLAASLASGLRVLPANPTPAEASTLSPTTYFAHHPVAGPYTGTIFVGRARLLALNARIQAVLAITTYFQIHNTAAAPALGAIPIFSFEQQLLAAGAGVLDINSDFLSTMGAVFSVGITYGLSSTAATFTAQGAGPRLTVNANRAT